MNTNDKQLIMLQKTSIILLDEFKRVCEKNSIPFFLTDGSLLGAVRHQGFIPWDDDVDVSIFERDAERLDYAMKRDLGDQFYWMTINNTPDYHLSSRKLCLNGTTVIKGGCENWDMHQGMRMDVYPLHEVSKSKVGRFRQRCWTMVHLLSVRGSAPAQYGRVAEALMNLIIAVMRFIDLDKHALSVMNKHLGKRTGIICRLCCNWTETGIIYSQEAFDSAIPCRFEEREMPIPQGYDEFLCTFYGKDYMTPPPPEDRRGGLHENVFVDLDTDYTAYRGIKYLTL